MCRNRSKYCLIHDMGPIGFTLKNTYMHNEGDPKGTEIIETVEILSLTLRLLLKEIYL